MSRHLVVVALTLLATVNLSAFAVAEAASGPERSDVVVVAVLDTGVSPAPGARLLPGIDLVAGDDDAADENGHGTAVAATIARHCESCTILPVRVLSRAGLAPWPRVAAGIVWAVDNGARVVNVSIAGPNGSAALRDAVAYAAARDVLVVASAGNGGDARRQYPAAYRSVVAVAAADSSGRLADWSSRGGWVDVIAPGCGELPQAGGGSDWACGTSFAAPLAAALAGATFAADPDAAARSVATTLPARAAAAQPRRTMLRVSGSARPGSLLRASLSGARGQPLRWFRCATTGSPHACAAVSAGPTYRVRTGDAGWTLVARATTKQFGGLWLASSPRLAVEF